MPEQSIIVWDLETVPDLAAAARLFDLGDASDAEVREALGLPAFLKFFDLCHPRPQNLALHRVGYALAYFVWI
jgi:hypothetical protein